MASFNIGTFDLVSANLLSGTKQAIEEAIFKSLEEFIKPQLVTIAKEQAEKVCKGAALEVFKDSFSGAVHINVIFKDSA